LKKKTELHEVFIKDKKIDKTHATGPVAVTYVRVSYLIKSWGVSSGKDSLRLICTLFKMLYQLKGLCFMTLENRVRKESIWKPSSELFYALTVIHIILY
jgi:hypothetical protein